MRLHELTLTAFGPFAETATVDFDDLGSAGLFLLTGPTGAGKSSLLDGVCFALYGEVPGERAAARHLRSDHAAPDAEPRVQLVLSVGDRVLRLTRTPAWDRPKRRGDGTRRIQASVVAEERRGGTWEAVSTRLDETGHLVGELLGMTASQFTQVALLPQGRFQTFLRASSAERHAVLQRLFRTRRYDDVEHWLAERRRQAHRASQEALARCRAVLDRTCEAVATELPEELAADLATALLGDVLPAWRAQLHAASEQEVAHHDHATHEALTHVDRLRVRLEAEHAVARARTRGLRARQDLEELSATSDDVDALRERLLAHAAAAPVRPLALRQQESGARLQHTTASLARAQVGLQDAPGSTAALQAHQSDLARRHAVAQSWLPRERERDALRAAHREAERRCGELTVSVGELGEQLDTLEHEARAREAEREPLTQVAARLPDLVAAADHARAGLEAAHEVERATEALREAVARQQEQTDEAQRRREDYLDVRERRITGIAVELASGLAVGCSCPVCGSVEHPSPAAGRSGTGKAEEDAARALSESAEAGRMAAGEVVSGVRSRLAAWQVRSEGRDSVDWAREQTDGEADLTRARHAARRLAAVDADLDRLRPAAADAGSRLAVTRTRLTERRREADDLVHRLTQADEELDRLLGDRTGAAALIEELDARLGQVADLLALHDDHQEARRAAEQATATASEALAAAGFADVTTCLAAVLDDDVRRRGEEQVTSWSRRRAEAQHTLDDPEVAAALAAPPAPPEVTADLLDAAVSRHEELLGHQRAARVRRERLAALSEELDAHLARWRPLQERHHTVAGLAGLVEGTSPDNRLRMRLTGYVLAERLRQVVAAANERLATMTDQRFALEHAEEKGVGEQRGGLSLRVRDDWSGTLRDPATLSGGESFVVSLALALGLADTVAHEAGGTTIETLFVDEGFGALDADTLDAVMDVLDGLRDGGRVVGLVSHVAELRARVPAQLEVRKGRGGGSTVAPAVRLG